MTSLYYLSNFDIFSPEEFVIDYTKVYVGKDMIKKIISSLTNYNYSGYLNNKIINITFTFENSDYANEFYHIIQEQIIFD